jgi:hypothetical protein
MEKNAGRTMLMLAGLVSLVVWFVPALRPVLWPLTLFNTYAHELSHAVATVLTGGRVESIQINVDGSGVTTSAGGVGIIIASAGYIGSAVLGGLIFAIARNAQAARAVCFGAAVVLVASLVLVVRGEFVGWTVGLAWAVLLGVSAKAMPGPWIVFWTRFLGFQLALTAVHSLGDLLLLSREGEAVTDAVIVQSMTGMRALVVAMVWAMVSVVCIGFAARHAWKNEPDSV